MGVDYYAILNIPHEASLVEIKLAYRKWAARNHPDYEPNRCDLITTADDVERPLPTLPRNCYWFLLNEAYDVLTDPLFRQVYDIHGEEGLKRGVSTKNGYFKGYKFHGDCRRIYEQVFGNYSPYADIIDAVTNPPPLVRYLDGTVCLQQKPNDVERVLYLTLEEVLYGGIKKMKILRHEFIDGLKMETTIREKTLIIQICPGVVAGTELRFPREGDQGPSIIPADIVFIVADKPHDYFTRNGADLHRNELVTLKEALCGCKRYIGTLDEKKIAITINDVISPDYYKVIEGEGLPYSGDRDGRRGNIIIFFQIKYPAYIPKQIKLKLSNLLDDIEDGDVDPEEQMNQIARFVMEKKIKNENK